MGRRRAREPRSANLVAVTLLLLIALGALSATAPATAAQTPVHKEYPADTPAVGRGMLSAALPFQAVGLGISLMSTMAGLDETKSVTWLRYGHALASVPFTVLSIHGLRRVIDDGTLSGRHTGVGVGFLEASAYHLLLAGVIGLQLSFPAGIVEYSRSERPGRFGYLDDEAEVGVAKLLVALHGLAGVVLLIPAIAHLHQARVARGPGPVVPVTIAPWVSGDRSGLTLFGRF